jgi:two-component system sensor kinase FixL
MEAAFMAKTKAASARNKNAHPNHPSAPAEKLRVSAELRLRKTRREVAQMRMDEVHKLMHELQVHQIELEMQNDQLRLTQLELEQARDRYADLYDFAPIAHLTLSASGEILEANLKAAELLGVERGRLIHQKFSRFVLAEAQDAFNRFCRQVFRSDTRQSAELDLLSAQAKRLVVQVEAVRDATNHRQLCRFSFTDISERKRAEERIAQLNRVQTINAGIDRAILHIPDRQKLLDEVCRVAVDKGGFKLAWIGMVAPEGSVQPVAQAGATGYLEGIRVVTHDVLEGRGPVGMAIRENRPVVIEDIDQSARMAPWRDRARQFGLHYVAAFPIRIAGKVAGSFQVYAPRADFFDEHELGLLTQVSDDISFALTALSDLTARKQAEEALRRSEHNLSNFFNYAPIGLEWLSAGGSILRANRAQLDLLGYAPEEYLGHFFGEFCTDPAVMRQLLERLAANETVRSLRMVRRRKDGALRLVLVDAQPLWNEGQFLYSSIFSRDITERADLEREILEISEREHRRIAQDLHDGLGQLLVGTAYLGNTLRQELASKSLPEVRQMDRLLQVLDEAIRQTRSLARGLHPVKPEPNGLMAALQELASQTSALFHVACRFICRRPVLIEDSTTATHLYRIAQEAVTNAIKHGKPGLIQISLTRTPGRINLAVKDNGVGLPARPWKQRGLGLRIMRYRAGTIGGSLAIQKETRGGTTVVCSVPQEAEGPERVTKQKD